MDREERYENRQWNDAVRDAKKAFNQFSDFDWKVYEDEPKRAVMHLRMALDDFNSAMNHIEKADVGEPQKGAVTDMNRGIKELNEAMTELDNGDVKAAQRHYNEASNNFDKASAILD